MSPKQELRVLVGLLVQPLVAVAAAFALFPALDYTAAAAGIYQGRLSDPAAAAASVAAGAGIASVFVLVFGALPAIGWLAARRPITLGASLIAGAALGNVPPMVILALAASNRAIAWAPWLVAAFGLIRALAFGACVGMVCGAAFWGIAGTRRVPAEAS